VRRHVGELREPVQCSGVSRSLQAVLHSRGFKNPFGQVISVSGLHGNTSSRNRVFFTISSRSARSHAGRTSEGANDRKLRAARTNSPCPPKVAGKAPGISHRPIRSRTGPNRPFRSPRGKIPNHSPGKQFRFSFANPHSFASFARCTSRTSERIRTALSSTGVGFFLPTYSARCAAGDGAPRLGPRPRSQLWPARCAGRRWERESGRRAVAGSAGAAERLDESILSEPVRHVGIGGWAGGRSIRRLIHDSGRHVALRADPGPPAVRIGRGLARAIRRRRQRAGGVGHDAHLERSSVSRRPGPKLIQ